MNPNPHASSGAFACRGRAVSRPQQFSKQNLVAKYNYENVSSVLFISPALACVGLTERVARLLGAEHKPPTAVSIPV